MGYDVHITRAEHWTESDDEPIELAEWLAYVERDPEMRLDGFAEAVLPSRDVLRTDSPGLAVWVAYSRHGIGGGMAWFTHWRGQVIAKNPDDEILAKMRVIAVALRARVQGDDGELY